MQKQAFVRARRAFVLFGVLGLLVTVVSMFMTATQLQDTEQGAADVSLLGLVLFKAERGVLEGATTASLRPGLGVVVVLIVIPAAAAFIAYHRAQQRAHAEAG